jgi:hypothetical protein
LGAVNEFSSTRSGCALWSFDWEAAGQESYVMAYNWESDLPTMKLHQKEADAYPIITFAFVEILNNACR